MGNTNKQARRNANDCYCGAVYRTRIEQRDGRTTLITCPNCCTKLGANTFPVAQDALHDDEGGQVERPNREMQVRALPGEV